MHTQSLTLTKVVISPLNQHFILDICHLIMVDATLEHVINTFIQSADLAGLNQYVPEVDLGLCLLKFRNV